MLNTYIMLLQLSFFRDGRGAAAYRLTFNAAVVGSTRKNYFHFFALVNKRDVEFLRPTHVSEFVLCAVKELS